MNSPFANIFTSVQQRIAAEVTTVSFIDQDLGQLRAGIRPPVSWPCVLIDFEDFTFSDLGENVQIATGTVVLRLGFAPYSGTSQLTPTQWQQLALGYYDIEWSLHKAMQGWSPGSSYGALCRTDATTQKRNDNYRVREIRYSISFDDYSTKHTLQYVPATLVVTDEINL